MRIINTAIVCITAIFAVLSLTSCDPMSSVDYKIYNMTGDTVTVDMYDEILESSYQGFSIEENDSVTTYYGPEDSITVAILGPDQVLWVHDDWHGLYREEWIVPVWTYIRSIEIADQELEARLWKSESAWHLKSEGGGFGEGESRYYSFFIRK